MSATASSVSCARDRLRLLYVSPERLVGEGSAGFRRLLKQTSRALRRHRRSALHQPVGARLPSRVPPAGPAARRVPRRRSPCLHRHRDRAGAPATSSPSCGCAIRRCWSGRSIAPTCTYRVIRRGHLHKQLHADSGRGTTAKSGIVYCSSRKEVESLAEWLRREGHQALPYHAGLPDEVRARIRRSSSTSGSTSSSRRWRSAWASIARTSGS